MVEQVWQNIRHLQKFPGTGHSRIDLAGSRDLLFWPVGRFLVLYRVTDTSVEIAAVLHGSRDIPAILLKRDAED
jgi:plasmid stabilization system protein ParE